MQGRPHDHRNGSLQGAQTGGGTVAERRAEGAAASGIDITTATTRRLNNTDVAPSALNSIVTFDVVTVALKPTCVTTRTIRGLQQFVGPRTIHVVTKRQESCPYFEEVGPNVKCYQEDEVIPGLTADTVEQLLLAKNPSKKGPVQRKGWYFQQLIKLGLAQSTLSLPEYYVVWDVDMMPMRPFKLFVRDPAGATLSVINIGGLVYNGYQVAYKRLLGRPITFAPDNSSLVVHHMAVNRQLMLEMLAEFEAKIALHKPLAKAPDWVWAVINAVDDSTSTGFSEYWTYHSWLLQAHPETVAVKPNCTWLRAYGQHLQQMTFSELERRVGDRAQRLMGGPAKLTTCCPTPEQLQELGGNQFDFIGVEIGHGAVQCNFHHRQFEAAYLPGLFHQPLTAAASRKAG